MLILRADGTRAAVEWIGTICASVNPGADPVHIEIAPKAGFLLNVDGRDGISLLEMTVPASEVERMKRVAPHLFHDPEPVSPLPQPKPTLRQLCRLEAELERRHDLAHGTLHCTLEKNQ